MREPQEKELQIEHTLLLGLFIVLLLVSPMLTWWAAPSSPWYLPYLLWLGIILTIAWVNRRRRHVP